MEATELVYSRSGAQIGKTKYLRLGNKVYLVDLESPMSFEVWGDAIWAVADKERIDHDASEFFIIQTHVAYPSHLSPGNFQVLAPIVVFREDRAFVGGFAKTMCPEEVREAFRAEIG